MQIYIKDMSNREYTPDEITTLPENGVFVFGSNSEGRHGKGAAKIARDKFGAIQGKCCGPMGNSYGIVTKKNFREPKSSTLDEIRAGIAFFLGVAISSPHKKFYVTKLGSSLAGYTIEEIRGIFLNLKEEWGIIPSDNVILPKEYEIRE